MAKSWMGLIGVFLLVLAIRLIFAFQTPYFTSDDAYLHVRYVEHVLATGRPLWDDDLGFGGRTLVLSPVFDYILAFFALFFNLTIALKVIPNIFAALIVFPAYLISFRLVKTRWIALFCSLLAGFVPVFFSQTFNQVSPLSIAVPLFFFLIYAWLRAPKRSWVFIFLAGLLLLVFLHPLSLVLVLSIGVYAALARVVRFEQSLAELELSLFSLFFAIWAQFLLYKKLILFHGPAVIWQNIPKQLLSAHFAQFSILGAIWKTGVLPLICGTYVLYKFVFRQHERDIYVLFSFTASVFVLLWARLIDISDGLMLLGILLVLVFSKWLVLFLNFVRQSKASKWEWVARVACIVLILLTSVVPALTEAKSELSKTISPEEMEVFEWIKQNTPQNATIVAPVNYGNYITALGERKNVIDSYFLLRRRANERLVDTERIYRTVLETETVSLMDKYSASYILIPIGMKDLGFASPCFKRVYEKRVRIYEKNPECHVRVVS